MATMIPDEKKKYYKVYFKEYGKKAIPIGNVI
jgi:hypothetical protein